MKKKELIHMAIGLFIWAPISLILRQIAEPTPSVIIIMGGVWGCYIGHVIGSPTSGILSFNK